MAKLVEILARELKEWPGLAVVAVQDGDKRQTIKFAGSRHTQLGRGLINPEKDRIWQADRWDIGICCDFDCAYLAEDHATAIVTRAEWQAAVDALYPPLAIKEEWDGAGLPPAGTVCEWAGYTYAPEDPREPDLHVGDSVEIIAHFKDGDFDLAAFIFNPKKHNPVRGMAWVNQGGPGCFRPIRTPEQIAAEDRDLAIAEMVATAKMATGFGQNVADHAALYDAGYRKQEPK